MNFLHLLIGLQPSEEATQVGRDISHFFTRHLVHQLVIFSWILRVAGLGVRNCHMQFLWDLFDLRDLHHHTIRVDMWHRVVILDQQLHISVRSNLGAVQSCDH